MQASETDRLLEATRAAGRRTRSILAANSFPMILFGVLALASAPVAESVVLARHRGLVAGRGATGLGGHRALVSKPRAGARRSGKRLAVHSHGGRHLGGRNSTGHRRPGRCAELRRPPVRHRTRLPGLRAVGTQRSVAAMAGGVLVSAIALALLRPPHAYTVGIVIFGVGSVLIGVVSLVRERRIDG